MSIHSVGELLAELMDHVRASIADFEFVQHGPMIGDMYEGSLREVLSTALPESLDLQFVRGKIVNSKGNVSRQIDCMLVEGEGKRLPGTDHFVYDVERVLAVIEVKKTLGLRDIDDAHDLLVDVSQRIHESEEAPASIARDAWRGITLTEIPAYDVRELTDLPEQLLLNSLMLDAALPLRIVFGYFGYKTEKGLRDGFVRSIERASTKAGLSSYNRWTPVSLPNLVIAGDRSLIKLNGMPYSGCLEEGWWWFYGSRNSGAMLVLLELLWTRLSYSHNLAPWVFGDDLHLESVSKLLRGRPFGDAAAHGWAYYYLELSERQLKANDEVLEWEPAFLTLEEFVVVSKMLDEGHVDPAEPDIRNYLERNGWTTERLAESLREKRLAYTKGSEIRPLTDQCRGGLLPGGRFFAGEDRGGRLTAWLAKYVRENPTNTRDPEVR